MERACGPSCCLQAGAASGEDEDRLLQGCEPARRLSYHLVRLSGFSVSSPEDDLEWKGRSRLHARRQSESVDGHQPDRSALVASSPQRQVPAGAGREVQRVHSRLDHLLQPLLQDAVASDPEEDRCLCHSVGAPQVQADAPSDQGRARLVRPATTGESPALRPLASMSWQRPNIGSRVNREVHARFWERPGVKLLRATRQRSGSS